MLLVSNSEGFIQSTMLSYWALLQDWKAALSKNCSIKWKYCYLLPFITSYSVPMLQWFCSRGCEIIVNWGGWSSEYSCRASLSVQWYHQSCIMDCIIGLQWNNKSPTVALKWPPHNIIITQYILDFPLHQICLPFHSQGLQYISKFSIAGCFGTLQLVWITFMDWHTCVYIFICAGLSLIWWCPFSLYHASK